MNTLVMKFGGSSVESIEKMQSIAKFIIRRLDETDRIVVVVSAMGKTTNELISLAKTAAKNPSKREIDLLISTGEQVSVSLLTMILSEADVSAIGLTGFQAGIKTEGIHTKNKISDIDISRISGHFLTKRVVVVAGFQGLNEFGDITTLGRGGSDTTAIALAAKLECSAEIYTDVSGIYGVDPRLYPSSKQLSYISYEEMKELAFLGAKVMEPRSIDIAQRYQVPVLVSSAHTRSQGTWIKEVSSMEARSITGCSISEKDILVSIGHLPAQAKYIADLFIQLADNEINIDMISQTASTRPGFVNISFTANADDIDLVDEVCHNLKEQHPELSLAIDHHIVKVSLVGSGMRTQSGVAATLFKLFSDHHIDFKLVTTSEISISYTISKELKEKAVNLIAQTFNL